MTFRAMNASSLAKLRAAVVLLWLSCFGKPSKAFVVTTGPLFKKHHQTTIIGSSSSATTRSFVSTMVREVVLRVQNQTTAYLEKLNAQRQSETRMQIQQQQTRPPGQDVADASSADVHEQDLPLSNTNVGHHLETPIHNFASIQECLNFLDAQRDAATTMSTMTEQSPDMAVVMYYASYCRICKRASITYKKLASTAAYEKDFVFARVEAGRLQADLLKKLGLTKFPFMQIFRKGKCVGK